MPSPQVPKVNNLEEDEDRKERRQERAVKCYKGNTKLNNFRKPTFFEQLKTKSFLNVTYVKRLENVDT